MGALSSAHASAATEGTSMAFFAGSRGSVKAQSRKARPVAAQVLSGLVLLWLIAVVGYVTWRSRNWPIVLDTPLLHYMAWNVQHGGVPYRDLLDMNPPGSLLLHCTATSIVGHGHLGWRIFDVVCLAATAAIIALYCGRSGRLSAAIGALIYALFHLSNGATACGQRDFVVFPILLLALYCVGKFWSSARPLWVLGICGFALGTAATIKPHVALLWLALAWIAATAARRRGRGWVPVAGMMSASALVPIAAVCAWLYWLGGMTAFLEMVFGYALPLYSKTGTFSSPFVAVASLMMTRRVAIVLALSAGVSLGALAVRGKVDVWFGLVALGLVYGIAHLLIQGKGFPYHLYPFAGFCCVAAAIGLGGLLSRCRVWLDWAAWAAVAAFAVLGGLKAARMVGAAWPLQPYERAVLIQRDLAPLIADGDTVQVLDTAQGGIHALLLLGVRQPTRLIYDFQVLLHADAPFTQRLRREVMGGLEARPPAFVVVLKNGWPTGKYGRLEQFPDLASWLRKNYRIYVEGSGYRIHARRQDR